jgi:hypothetical protein
VRSLTRRAHYVADGYVQQAEAADRLRASADAAYDEEIRKVLEATADGTLLRGEVLVRWQEFVGTGELLRSLEAKVGRVRDRMVNAIKGKPQQAERVNVAVESSLESLIVEHAEAAAERAEASWQGLAPGQALLSDVGEDLGRASRSLRRQAERAVREWQQDVLDMVRTEGADKRTTARVLAYGVNGLSVALMVVVFASTAGITGAEVGIAGGSALLGQKLLEAVFGDQALRTLAEQARLRLETRVARRGAPPLPRPAREPRHRPRGGRAAAQRRPDRRRPALRQHGAIGHPFPVVGAPCGERCWSPRKVLRA